MEIKRQRSYEIYAEDELKNHAKETIFEVMDVLALPSKSITLILLSYFKWNTDHLISAFSENQDDVSKKAGIYSYDLEEVVDSPPSSFECPICFDVVGFSETFALGCGHRQCRECYRGYLEMKVKDKVDAIRTTCPGKDCQNIVHDRAFKSLCSPESYKRYKSSLFRSLVNDNPHVKYCPSPNCTNMVRCERKNRLEPVNCLCGYSFCFSCADYDIGDHVPCSCKEVSEWFIKRNIEEVNVQWIIANCKKCPRCSKPIEKNGGCMHMACRTEYGGCGFEFCWLCRGTWQDHGSETGGYYACNRYDTSDAKKLDEQNEQFKLELDEYAHYFSRFNSHLETLKLDEESPAFAQAKCDAIISKFEVRAQDTQYILDANQQIRHNRRILSNSYIYGYYLDKDNEAEKYLFEHLQTDLEANNERLSKLYERDLESISDKEEFIEWKEDVTNFTRVTAQFLDKFITGVMRGLTE